MKNPLVILLCMFGGPLLAILFVVALFRASNQVAWYVSILVVLAPLGFAIKTWYDKNRPPKAIDEDEDN